MQAKQQLQVLKEDTDKLYNSLSGYNLPAADKSFLTTIFDGVSSDNLLDELNHQIHEIEARVQEALERALKAQELTTLRDSTQYFDAVSMSSGAGLSLAMDVIETEAEPEESAREEETVPNPRAQLNHLKEIGNSLEQFYCNLDVIEEYLEKNKEYLPFEGIEEKVQILEVSEYKIFGV